jgi:integrase
VRAPRVVRKQLVPWTREQVTALRTALPERYRAMVDCGAGLGLRQGAVFGLCLSEIDWLRKIVHVRQQVRLQLGAHPVFAAPKGRKPRQVPPPESVGLALAVRLERFPARPVTLPWESAEGKPRTEELLFTSTLGRTIHNAPFNGKVWASARDRAGIPASRDAGMHQLRHHYASMLLRGGIDLKRAAVLGLDGLVTAQEGTRER